MRKIIDFLKQRTFGYQLAYLVVFLFSLGLLGLLVSGLFFGWVISYVLCGGLVLAAVLLSFMAVAADLDYGAGKRD